MKLEERSAQIWGILAIAARNRQVLTYGIIARAIGAPAAALGGWLDPIQKYCLSKGLPALTAIVVSEDTGLPGMGFTAASDVPGAQALVFAFDWLAIKAPRTDDFAQLAAKA